MIPARSARTILLAMALAIGVVVAPLRAGAQHPGATPDAQTLVVAYNYNPTSLDPGIAYDGVGPTLFRACYEQLVRLKGSSTTQYEGELATHWTSNAAKSVWTFYLRHGVLFHDGTPLTADAVRFSINRTLSLNQAPAFIMGQFMTAKDVKVIDPYTVQFNLKKPAPDLLAAMASQWGNWIVSPTTIKAHTVKHDWGQAWLANHDAGSGPYMLSHYVPNSSFTLVKFPRYWRGWSGRHISRIIVTFVIPEATRRSLIEKGDADISLTFSPENLRAMASNPQLKEDVTPGVLQEVLVPTVAGPFASPKARLALVYAFDYDAMNKQFLKGLAVQAQGPVAHGIYGHDFSLPLPHTDLAKARQLFAQAGVKPGTTLSAWYISNDPLAREIALITQGQLGQLGFNVKLTQRDGAAYINEQGAPPSSEPISQRPNLWVSNWFPDYSDPIDVITPLYHTRAGLAGSVNMGLYSNKKVDQLLAQAAVTADAAKQLQMFYRIQYILTYADPAAVYISDASNEYVYRASLHGYYSNPIYGYTFDFYTMYK